MSYRFVLDENLEREVLLRLVELGHDVVHVDNVSSLGKGIGDNPIARYSKKTGRVIVSYDDDFVLDMDETDYHAVFYVSDGSMSPETVANAVHAITERYPQDEIGGLVFVSEAWL